jgi:hypothetical protein
MQKNPGRGASQPLFNFTPARRPEQRAATKGALDFLHSNERLAALLPTLSQLASLQSDCERQLPTLFASCRVLQLRDGALQVAVPNAALATRLKQVLPKLQDGLRQKGWPVEAVKLKVQLMPAVPQPPQRPVRHKALSSEAAGAFAELEQTLEDSPRNAGLRDALKALLARR